MNRVKYTTLFDFFFALASICADHHLAHKNKISAINSGGVDKGVILYQSLQRSVSNDKQDAKEKIESFCSFGDILAVNPAHDSLSIGNHIVID